MTSLPKVLVCALIVLDLAIAIAWANDGNWRQTSYWILVAGINALVTF